MRRMTILVLACLMGISCGGTSPQAPPPEPPPEAARGRLQVYVYFEDHGLPGKRLELLETGESRTTDENGIAEFLVPAREYVLRAYDLTMPGPSRPIDRSVSIRGGETTRVEIIDCLPCMSTRGAGG